MSFKDAVSVCERCWGDGIPSGSCEQAHIDVDVRKHVKKPEWETRYDESVKLFDESLQNSWAAVSLRMIVSGA